MTTHDRDKVIAAAKETGFSEVKSRPSDTDVRKGYRLSGEFKGWKASPTQLEAFYAIAFEAGRVAEREACAVVCERLISGDGICADNEVWIHDCAESIRARGDTK